MKQMIVQRQAKISTLQNQIQQLSASMQDQQQQAETSVLQNQIQQLNASMQQQQQYYANMFTNGPPVFPNTTYPSLTVPPNQSSLNSSLIQELSYSLNMQTQINKQHQLNMVPSYDGKDPKQFYTWLYDIEILSIQNTMTKTEVHKLLQEDLFTRTFKS